MLYEQAKSLIQNGDVFAFEGHGAFSRLIGLRTHSYITHVGFALWLRYGFESADRLCVFEAMNDVRVAPMAYVMAERASRKERVHWLKLDESFNGDEVVGFALERWCQEYSGRLQFLSSFGRLTNLVRRTLGFPAEVDKNRPFCSWVVAEALQRAGFDWKTPAAETTPVDVFEFKCLSHQGIITL